MDGSLMKVYVQECGEGKRIRRYFPVEVGVHQGSVLSHYSLSCYGSAIKGLMTEDCLGSCYRWFGAVGQEDLKRKLQRWKSGLEAKGLRVNVGKTKVMCGVGLQKVVDSRKYPCGVCGKGVDANSIKCTLSWNGYTSAVVTSLRRHSNVSREPRVQIRGNYDGSKFDLLSWWLLCAGGGAEEALGLECGQLGESLMKRHADVSLKLKGKIYDAFTESVGIW